MRAVDAVTERTTALVFSHTYIIITVYATNHRDTDFLAKLIVYGFDSFTSKIGLRKIYENFSRMV